MPNDLTSKKYQCSFCLRNYRPLLFSSLDFVSCSPLTSKSKNEDNSSFLHLKEDLNYEYLIDE